MAEPPVVNTTPLVILNRVGLLDWLRLAGDPVLESLRQAGLYLSDRVLNQALAQVGE